MNSFRCCSWVSVALLTLLSAISVQADTIPITLSMTLISELRPNTNIPTNDVPPDTLTLSTIKRDFVNNSDVAYLELELTDLEPDSIDRMLHYMNGDPSSSMWTINSGNADAFGVNWLEFQNHLNESRPSEVLAFMRFFDSPPSPIHNPTANGSDSISEYLRRAGIQKPNTGELWATNFQLHEVKIWVDYYFWHPVLEGLRAVQIRAEIRGEAQIIPEPLTLSTLLFGLVMLGRVRVSRSAIADQKALQYWQIGVDKHISPSR